ncbi:MAG: hypothetical protein Q9225_000923 [Loekoesia sp. 1 TL-2023]
MSEDQELLARIGQLAGTRETTNNLPCTPDQDLGHINLYKAQPSSPQPTAYDQASTSSSSPYASRGYSTWRSPRSAPYRARGRGASRRYPSNHSLVLNRESSQSPATNNVASSAIFEGTEALQPAAAYVSKRGRHRQLINSSVLDKVMLQRRQAIESTQQRKALMNDQRERQRMRQYIEGLHTSPGSSNAPTSRTASSALHRIEIDGLNFEISKEAKVQHASIAMILRRLQYARPIFKRGPVRQVIPVICRTIQHLSEYLPACTFYAGSAQILLADTRMFALTHLLRSARILPS